MISQKIKKLLSKDCLAS